MSSFEKQAHYWSDYRRAVIQQYRDEVRNAMLARIVMPLLTDPDIARLARELSLELRCGYSDANELLRPTAHAIYAAAKGANDGRA